MGVDSWPTGSPATHRAGETGDVTPSGRPRPVRRVNGTRPPAAAGNGSRIPAADVEPGGTTTRVDRSAIAAPRHRADTRAIVVGGPLGDQRGLSAAGAVVVLLLLGGVGAIIDKALGHGLWMFFSIAFVAGVLLNAVRVHIEDLAASIVIVPLTYAIIGMSTSLGSDLGNDRVLKEKLVSAVGVLVLNAPILLLAVAVSTVIALGRGRSMTRARQRARARTVRRYGHLPGSRPNARSRSAAAPPSGGVRRR